jgi:hypothetical protein
VEAAPELDVNAKLDQLQQQLDELRSSIKQKHD